MRSLEQLKDPDYQRETLSGGLNQVNFLRKMKSHFTVKKLDACRYPFQVYLIKYGDRPPVHSRNSFLNTIGNYACSWTHFIKTNQDAARTVIKIINNVNENKKSNESLNVIHSLRKIRELYGILHGRKVKHAIKKMFNEFNLDLKGDNYISKKITPDNKEVVENIPLKEIEEILENEKNIDNKLLVELPPFIPY